MTLNGEINSLGCELNRRIGTDVEYTERQSIKVTTASVSTQYGQGNIYTFTTDGIRLYILDITLKKCVEIAFTAQINSIQATYIVKGCYILRSECSGEETLYEPFMQYLQVIKEGHMSIKFGKQTPFYMIQISFTQEYLKKYNPAFLYNNAGTIFKSNISQEGILSVFELEAAIFKKKLCFHLYVEYKCVALLSILIESLAKSESVHQDLYIKSAYDIKKYIDQNLHLNLTLDDLNKNTGISNFVLNKEFSKLTGDSVAKYIKSAKMNLAKELLIKTSLPIYEIADRTGYKNATHFSEAFKKHFHYTPKYCRGKQIK
ncbi:AraC family transcriptional regulator [Rapidithrix thailandica]|uniref:AraC family transcriptional regulator n=1 Tax=Rapidithrix thailandica TaxID=413964 RepID=A0AAW9RZ83_9BACT